MSLPVQAGRAQRDVLSMLLSAAVEQNALRILLASRSSILLATNRGLVRADARSVDDADARIAYMRPSKRAAALWGDQQ